MPTMLGLEATANKRFSVETSKTFAYVSLTAYGDSRKKTNKAENRQARLADQPLRPQHPTQYINSHPLPLPKFLSSPFIITQIKQILLFDQSINQLPHTQNLQTPTKHTSQWIPSRTPPTTSPTRPLRSSTPPPRRPTRRSPRTPTSPSATVPRLARTTSRTLSTR